MKSQLTPRSRLLLSTMLGAASLLPVQALAQAADDNVGLETIIVTAQKRAQDVQDVPIAVTALSAETLAANRVVNVVDLSGLAPGVTVRPSAGGSGIASFSVRGAVSYGVVPGSDKQVSVYLDGVYISSPRGSIFDLPDVDRIEMLRGPQGTLFGRNATAGAISISTRDPNGEVGVTASASIGNRDMYRFRTSIDLPQMGPFSGYVSYVHEERRGEVRNAGEGALWDRTASVLPKIAKVERSPRWLNSKNSDSWFAALKFESGDFTTVYKFDKNEGNNTPDATGLLAVNTSVPLLGSFLDTLIKSQASPVNFAADGKRPDVVNNSYAIPSTLEVEGHSLTSTYQVSDSLSIKNVFAYRKSFVFAAVPIDGVSGLTLTPQSIGPYATFVAFSSIPGLATASPAAQGAAIQQVAAGLAPLVGSPFIGIASGAQSSSQQYSDELQFNYDSDFLTATVGALWFHSKDRTAEHRLQNTISFAPVPGGVLRSANIGETYNGATSLAAYAQLEFHLTPQLDVVLGGRITQDKKSGYLLTGQTPAALRQINFTYRKTKPNYLVGVNYQPNQDLLLYAKYSTAFVSGGSVAGIPFDPETVKSWEAGVKAELLDRKLRTNLAVFLADYENVQTAQSATNFVPFITQATGDPNLASAVGTLIVPAGGVRAKGFEFDLTAAPLRGVGFGGGLGYTKTTFNNLNPVIVAASLGQYLPTLRPAWNGSLWAQYDTRPLTGDAYLSFRVDGIWQSDMNFAENPNRPIYKIAPAGIEEPAYWVLNGRVALRDFDLGGVKTQVALWGRNLTDKRAKSFELNLSDILLSANYIPARSYGVDLTIEF